MDASTLLTLFALRVTLGSNNAGVVDNQDVPGLNSEQDMASEYGY